MYLGCSLALKDGPDGSKIWTMSSHDYIKQSITVIEDKLKRRNVELPKRCGAPFTSSYHPADDILSELNNTDTQFYQETIGMLRWAVEVD